MLQGQRILLTGGGGFIGSHLCERLVEKNELVVFDNGHRDALGKSHAIGHPNLKRVQGNVLDGEQVGKAMAGCTVVIHMAAIAGIETVVTRPIQTMQVNLLGSYHVLEAAARQSKSLEHLVAFSTSEVYGPHVFRGAEDGLTTAGAVGEPRWTYAVSKLAAEHLAYSYQLEFGIPVTIVRPFNIYGPRQVGEGAIRKFCEAAIKNDAFRITGDGNQIRAWCYIDDFVEALLLILERKTSIGHVFNIGNPKQTASILGLAEQVIRLAGSSSVITFSDQKMADVEVRVPSIQKARQLLGFEPKIGLEEGIARTLRWMREG